MEPTIMNEEEYNSAVAEIAEMKVAAEAAIAKGEAHKRLLQNPDFKLVYLDGYCKEYPQEIAEAIATNTGAYDEAQLIVDLKAVTSFNKYGFQVASQFNAGEQSIIENDLFLASVEIQ